MLVMFAFNARIASLDRVEFVIEFDSSGGNSSILFSFLTSMLTRAIYNFLKNGCGFALLGVRALDQCAFRDVVICRGGLLRTEGVTFNFTPGGVQRFDG